MDEPFSPSCDFNQCVLVWLRAEGLVFKSLESPKFFSLGFYRLDLSLSLVFPSQSHGIKSHEDTMMGSHPGGRVTACSVRCSIFEYLMAMMVGDLTLGREGTSLASVRVPYDISPCPDELTIGYCFVGLKSLELYPIGALVFFGCWSKAIRKSVTSCLPVVLLNSTGGCQFFRERYGTELIHRIHLRTRELSMSRWVLIVIRFREIQLHMITQMHLFYFLLMLIQFMMSRTRTGAIQS
ncbi:hypothetical protein IGI04_040124 [Brassica rapa subsp. trilocularis]|uniref:Uncharacterized protein n=1 Tax=Brassica rapa subsp. trilocularis TaxID=1813537 RepID=A0ABQ7KMR2_BRACM|nr:hypothetical protein IGI04_040124 [Brassica rapa subsp. trilocularis]